MTDGVIFCHGSAKERMEALSTIMPMVFVESMPKNPAIDRVLVDGTQAFRKMFNYLLACGFKRDIAIVYGKEDSFSNLRREQCELVLAELVLSIASENIRYGNWRPQDGYVSMQELLGQKNQMIKQNDTLSQQQFENTFFQLLTLYNSIVNSLDIRKRDTKAVINSGRDCFEVFYNKIGIL